jgi:cobalt transporter subunit CbtA
MLFRQIVFYALLVGILAGLVVTLVQAWQVVPIILSAEAYEGAAAEGVVISALAEEGHHAAEAQAWAPADGFERTAFTLLSNSLTAMAFAMLLMAAMLASLNLKGTDRFLPARWYGLVWGASGYLVFWLAPALGLPPEIPLQVAAELEARQIWWVFAVVCTAGGLAGLAFGPSPWRWGAPLLLLIPHLVGAPHPVGAMFGEQPPAAAAALEALAQQFIGASAIANASLWLVLGFTSAWAVRRMMKSLSASSSTANIEAPSV